MARRSITLPLGDPSDGASLRSARADSWEISRQKIEENFQELWVLLGVAARRPLILPIGYPSNGASTLGAKPDAYPEALQKIEENLQDVYTLLGISGRRAIVLPAGLPSNGVSTLNIRADSWRIAREKIEQNFRDVDNLGFGGSWGAGTNVIQTFADNFNRADENLEASANWTQVPGVTGGVAVVSNKLNVIDTLSAGTFYLAPDIGSGNQYAEAVWSSTLTPSSFSMLRYQDASNWVGYRVLLTGRLIELYKRVAATLTLITQIWNTPVAGDVVRLELFGTKAVFKVNGLVRGGPYEMGSLFPAATKAGLWGRSGPSASLWDDFACGKVNSVMSSGLLNVAAYGDSLTAGQQSGSIVTSATSWPAQAQAASGRYFMNGGQPGETSTSIKTRAVAASQSDNMSRIMVIWAGRNNYSAPATVMADIASMVAACTSGKFIVMSVLNDETTDGGSGGVQYGQIVTTLNAGNIAVTYPSNYLDVRGALVALGAPGQPYADPTMYPTDRLPSGLVSDGIVHLNTAGYAVVAAQVNAFIASKGW